MSHNREQALAGLTDRATTYGWQTIVRPTDWPFNVEFFRDLTTGQREVLSIRLSHTGLVTRVERNLGTDTRLDVREVFKRDKRTAVQLAMSASPINA
jgi:hypothetical protein